MSLVGTRPILPDELEQYELHHRARIAIKPGIECIRRKYYAYEFDFKLCIKFNPKDVVWFCREKVSA